MKLINTLFFVLFLTAMLASCFSEKVKTSPRTPVSKGPPKNENSLLQTQSPQTKVLPPELFKKEQREAIYFSASLEKEALKLLTKNPAFDELTLFSVLSYALETSQGVKKNPPMQLDCSRFRWATDSEPKSINKISVFKTCQKPESLIAEIEVNSHPSTLTVTFISKEWISVLGLSATLSGENVRCFLRIENKKLGGFRCENWLRTLGVTSTSAEELRLSTFLFERQNTHQLVLKGGIYKDLIERKKIEINVPFEGKIKRIEKEIEVIDQYADVLAEPKKAVVENVEPQRMLIKPIEPKAEQLSESVPVENQQPTLPVDILENQESGGVPAPAPSRRGR